MHLEPGVLQYGRRSLAALTHGEIEEGGGKGNMSFRFGKRFGSSKILAAQEKEGGKHKKAWAHLGVYRGSHHTFREQSLVEFLTDHPEQCKDLTDKEAEDIRRGCILLNDALAGRASHGLYSLLDDAAWKRVLFLIQTADWWQNIVITASFLHASLVFFEGVLSLPR